MPNENSPLKMLREIAEMIPEDNPRLRNYLFALERAIRDDEAKREENERLIQEYEEAYRKLTSPANRTAVYLAPVEDELALIGLGENEFVVSIDPKINPDDLYPGARVKINDAYAIIGTMPPHSGGQIFKVSETFDDGRIRVSQDATGSIGRIVYRGENLKDAQIKLGDEVRVEPNFKVAVEHFPQAETREYFYEDVPEIGWDQIGGQSEAIQLIKDTIEHPLLYPEIYERFDKKPIKGILLYGPPGCGKTLIGKATAYNLTKEYSKRVGHDVKEYFMYISGPKILNMWLGETERMVREIFQTARAKAKEGRLVFIFFDEAESVLRTRSNSRWLNIANTVVPQFCAELDGLVSLENVVLMLTSNRPDYIDPAILRPERIDRKVKINRPDQESTRSIFEIYLHPNVPLDPDAIAAEGGDVQSLRDCLLDTITAYIWRTNRETEYLRVNFRNGSSESLYWKDLISGALIRSVVDRAKDYAIKRAIAEPKKGHGIRLDDLKEAVKAEYSENEIFPKNDSVEDWLKLLDYEEDHVISLRPIKDAEKGLTRDNII
ncbi:MAG: AAA family ATPase [Fimbriimonadales bacterium]|nr:AAA family ATPase [Fimbriimonadales bacterium]